MKLYRLVLLLLLLGAVIAGAAHYADLLAQGPAGEPVDEAATAQIVPM